MKCPRCDIDLKNEHLEELLDNGSYSNVEVDVCPECTGIWFDKEELENLDNKIEPKIIEIKKLPPKNDQYKDLICPNCSNDSIMNKVVNDYDKDVIMDICPSCKGLWLDKGEFKAIKERSLFSLAFSVFKWAL